MEKFLITCVEPVEGAVFSHDELEQPASEKIHIHVPGPSDIIQDLDLRTYSACLGIFPEVDRRKFQAFWYLSNPWLEYFQNDNGIYCIACRHFAHTSTSVFALGLTTKRGRTRSRSMTQVSPSQ